MTLKNICAAIRCRNRRGRKPEGDKLGLCDAPYSAHAVARPGPARRRECTGPAGASRTCPRPSPTTRTLHKFTSHHTHSPGHRRSARHTSRRRSMPAGEERRAGRRRVAWPHRHGPTTLSLSLSRVARSSARRRPGALNTVLAGASYPPAQLSLRKVRKETLPAARQRKPRPLAAGAW